MTSSELEHTISDINHTKLKAPERCFFVFNIKDGLRDKFNFCNTNSLQNDNQKEWILVVEMTIQSGIVKGTVISLKLSKINFKFKQKKYDQIAFKSTKFHFIFL